jgi:hypothetical protein
VPQLTLLVFLFPPHLSSLLPPPRHVPESNTEPPSDSLSKVSFYLSFFLALSAFPFVSELATALTEVISRLGVRSTTNPPQSILTTMLSLKYQVSTPHIHVPGASAITQWRHAAEHKEHPHCPSSLHCLRDTDARPPHTLPVILRCTILGSPNKKLTIREIYAAMENKYPWYKTAGNAWKVYTHATLSIIHTLIVFSSNPSGTTSL